MKKTLLFALLLSFIPIHSALAVVTADDIILIESLNPDDPTCEKGDPNPFNPGNPDCINGSAGTPNIYLAKIACKFYQMGFPDDYDAIFVYSAYPLDFISNTQQGWPVQVPMKGVGRDNWPPQTNAFCASKGRLRQAVKMGNIDTMPNNPDARYTGIPFFALSGIQLVAHEFGHQFGASILFKKDGVKHCLARGNETSGGDQGPSTGDCDGHPEGDFNQHWSYYFNSRSLMYGSFIEDLGGGNFKLWYEDPKFSEIDQYIMGLRTKDEVSPMFLIDIGDPAGATGIMPILPGSTANAKGTRMDFTIDDVIAQLGPRIPEKDICHWKGITLVVYTRGFPPTPFQIQKLVNYANRWEEFYSYATDNRGSFDMTVDGRGTGNAQCSAPPVDGDFDYDLIDKGDSNNELPGDQEVQPTCPYTIRKCDGNLLVECNTEVDMWTLIRDCYAEGTICEVDHCKTVPADGDDDLPAETNDRWEASCKKGAVMCLGTVISECTGNFGNEWMPKVDCAPSSCEDGICIAAIDGDADSKSDNEFDGTGQKPGNKGEGCASEAAGSFAALLAALFAARKKRNIV